ARADGGDETRFGRLSPEEAEHGLVGEQRIDADAAGHAKDVELRAFGESFVGVQPEAGRGGQRVAVLPNEADARLRPSREHVVGTGQIELLDIWENEKADFDGHEDVSCERTILAMHSLAAMAMA